MSLPTLDKTYQYARTGAISTVNKYLTTTGSGINDQKTVLLQIINDFINFPLFPWTVIGSSNSVASSMDGVNRWAAIANLVNVQNAGTAHSWIVFQQNGINTKTQICFDLISPSGIASTSMQYINIIGSMAAGFGTANGGTDGSTTTRPTATDEFPLITTTSAINFTDGQTSGSSIARDYITSVFMSTDGSVNRALIRIPGTRYSMYFCLEKPKAPVSGWTTPVFGRWSPLLTNIAQYTTFNDTNYFISRFPGGILAAMYATCEAFVAAMAGQNILTRNELTGEWEMYNIGLASTVVGTRGRHGRIYDMWWCSTTLQEGDTFPSDGSRTFLCIGDMIIPWNGSIPLLS